MDPTQASTPAIAREAALIAARNAAEADATAKSEFLANVSHEIRTPMTAILGYAELLLDPEVDDARRREYVTIIQRNGEHLLCVLNDILDLTKLEAGKVTAERVRCRPDEIICEVVSLLRVHADGKGLALDVRYDTPIPVEIETDPTRLRQVLLNLVGNAIKFTEHGGVQIIVRCGLEASTLQVDVVDTGIGMSPTQLRDLFHPFEQADSSTTRRFGGTGLGLAISKRCAVLLGGDVLAASVQGRGSTFTVTIATGPLEGVQTLAHPSTWLPAAPPVPPVDTAALRGRVLLAEDGPDNQRLLAFHLRRAGLDVEIADNGWIAVKIAMDAWDIDRPFDLILMDMQMPILDGYDATRRLRDRGYRSPIVALTAHTMVGDEHRCLAVGCDGYLGKPLDRQTLLETVRRFTETAPARRAS